MAHVGCCVIMKLIMPNVNIKSELYGLVNEVGW